MLPGPPRFEQVLSMVQHLAATNHTLDHDDIAQEITVRCWREDRPTTWLEVQHLVIDRARRQNLHRQALPKLYKQSSEQPADLDTTDLVEKLLSLTTPRRRRLLTWLFLDELSVEQVAQLEHVTVRRVRQLAQAAINDIKTRIGDKLNEWSQLLDQKPRH